jgi:hypothetical protein
MMDCYSQDVNVLEVTAAMLATIGIVAGYFVYLNH